ncbi:MFS transporter [Amycolatopsis sp. NPDC059021]|uniref:MFS transporter n=1 Tax=Amycolatopsis sp. NPDC059021 TaxID=3346704 RepID=UPI00366FEE4B
MSQSLTRPPTADGPVTGTLSTGKLVASLLLATVTCQLIISMETPAMPDIARRLHADASVVGTGQAAFYLTGALLSIVMAAYSDHVNIRKLIGAALLVTLAGAVLAAAAPNVTVFVIGRVLQGPATAMFPLALRLLRQALPGAGFGRAMGLLTAANGGVVGLDGLLSGWLTDHYGFRAVFVLMAVVDVITFVVLTRTLPDQRSTTTSKLDVWGVVLLTLSIGCVEVGLGWLSGPGLGMGLVLLAGAVLFTVFCLVEKRRAHPLLPIGYLRSRRAWPVLLTSVLATAGMLGPINYLMPIYSQNHEFGFGMTATLSSILFVATVCLVNVLFAPVVGWFAPKVGWRTTLRVSMAMAVPCLALLALGIHQPWLACVAITLLGVAFAGALTPLNGLSAILANENSKTVLPGVNAAAYGIGSSLGILLASRLTAQSPGRAVSAADFQLSLWTDAAVLAVGFLIALAIGGIAGKPGERV